MSPRSPRPASLAGVLHPRPASSADVPCPWPPSPAARSASSSDHRPKALAHRRGPALPLACIGGSRCGPTIPMPPSCARAYLFVPSPPPIGSSDEPARRQLLARGDLTSTARRREAHMSVVRRREVLHIHTALAGPPCRRPPSQRRSHPSSPPPAAHSDPHRHRPLLHLTQREATSAVTSPLHRREDVSTARASSPTRAKTRRRPCIQMRWRAPLPLPPALAPGPSHASTRAAAVEPLLPRPEAPSSV